MALPLRCSRVSLFGIGEASQQALSLHVVHSMLTVVRIIWLNPALRVIKCSDCLCVFGMFLEQCNGAACEETKKKKQNTWVFIKVQAAKIILVAEKHPFSRESLGRWQWSNPTEPGGTAHPGFVAANSLGLSVSTL